MAGHSYRARLPHQHAEAESVQFDLGEGARGTGVRLIAASSCGAVLLAPAIAAAASSIVATDGGTRQVGGAGTSCVGTLSVTIILGLAPNYGAIHAQAQINTNGRDQGVMMLLPRTGSSPGVAATSPTG